MKSKSSNKSFGIVFSVVFLLVALWPILNENEIRFWALILSVIFLALGLLNSKILTPLKILWIKFGEKLGNYCITNSYGYNLFFSNYTHRSY